jgi:4,5-DOPA dioxygenase extradiol
MTAHRLPTYFISHGAPTLPLDQGAPAKAFLEGLGPAIEGEFGRPRAILMISAHWETDRPTVSSVAKPQTIHDFHGFADALYDLHYPSPGAPDVAGEVTALLSKAGFAAGEDAARGLDHGAWNPLLLMWPGADIPVLQLSVQTQAGPDHHLALGRALARLRDCGVLIIGSGAATHNLPEFRGQRPDAPAPDWARTFADWLHQTVEGDDITALTAYRDAPEGLRNHPTAEHFLPIFVAAGARSGQQAGCAIHRSFRYGIIAMDCYRFD